MFGGRDVGDFQQEDRALELLAAKLNFEAVIQVLFLCLCQQLRNIKATCFITLWHIFISLKRPRR